MAINLQECASKLTMAEDARRLIDIRKVSLGMIVNIINSYIKVHSLSQVELQALQNAINAESAETDRLISILAETVGVQDAQPQEGPIGAADAQSDTEAKDEAEGSEE